MQMTKIKFVYCDWSLHDFKEKGTFMQIFMGIFLAKSMNAFFHSIKYFVQNSPKEYHFRGSEKIESLSIVIIFNR